MMKRTIVVLMYVFAAVAPLTAQSPAMIERVESLMTALNGTPEQFETYAQQGFAASLLESTTAQQRRELQARIRAEFGAGITAEALLRAAPSRVKVKVKGSKKSGALLLDHEVPTPHKVLGLAIEGDAASEAASAASVARAPREAVQDRAAAELPPPPIHRGMDGAQLARALDPYLQQLTGDDRFAGAVLIARGGRPVFEKGYGLANRSDEVPNTPRTRFNVGSINKRFTQVAIAQLAAAGKLALGDPIGRHLPDYPVEKAKSATIEQLLSHRGGIRAWGEADAFTDASKSLYRTNRDFYRLVSTLPLEFDPGAREQYCNGCYVVLGEVVERLGGMPYERYIEQNVLAPARMKTTGFFQIDDPVPQVAVGYTRQRGPALRSNVFLRGAGPNAAGGAFATPADLLAFENAIRDGKLLDPKWTAWFVRADGPVQGRYAGAVQLGGGGSGVSSVLESDGTWTVVAMANLDSPAGSSVARALFAALTTT